MKIKVVKTICPYCGCGCGILVESIDNHITGVFPQKDHPINNGKLCIKGWNSFEYSNHKERLKVPLIRNGEDFNESNWDDALNLVAKKLKEIKENYGPDSIAFLCSAKCTNEDNYILQKFARAVIGTNNIDHCARL
jgi:predicted molibdopterin-dependent oxidoreductase YjgC